MFHASKISTFMGNLHKVRKIASKASLLLLTGKKGNHPAAEGAACFSSLADYTQQMNCVISACPIVPFFSPDASAIIKRPK